MGLGPQVEGIWLQSPLRTLDLLKINIFPFLRL